MKYTCLATISLIGFLVTPVSGLADNLAIGLNDNLTNQVSGDSADRSATHDVFTLSTDSSFQRNGVDGASFEYVIKGQASADDGVGGANDSASLVGDVTFDFDLPTALWTIQVDATFRGAQDVDGSDADASAGTMQISSAGSASNMSSLSLNSLGQQFFDINSTTTLSNSTYSGSGSISVDLNLVASSDNVSIFTGDEAYAGIGQFSTLSQFSTDDDLNALNSFADDGAYITLTFIPSLSLSGQTLIGDLALIDGEVLSGYGGVSGNISGDAGSSITATEMNSALTLGANNSSGFDFSGTLNVGASDVYLDDSDGAVLRGEVILNGGELNSSNGLIFESGASLSGSGAVSGDIAGVTGSSITATSGGLTLGNATSTSGFDFSGTLNVGSNTVTILDSNEANLGESTTLTGGILDASNGVSIDGSDTISGYGIIIGDVSGSNVPGGMLISTPTGNVSLNGTLGLNSETATIYSQLAAELGNSTTLSDATLIAANGLSLGNGDSLSVSGGSSVDAAIAVANNATVTINSGIVEIGDASSNAGFMSDGTMVIHSSELIINDANVAELGSSTTLNYSTLIAQNGVSIDGTDTIFGSGLIRGEITGTNAANGLVATGPYTPGVVNVGADTVTILTNATVGLNNNTTITGGTFRSTGSGFAVEANTTLAGYGEVQGDIVGRSLSTIEANGGDLSLGSINSFNGFRTDGEIKTGANKVTLNSATFAQLGTVTTIAGGALEATNGVFLSGGNVVTGSGAITGRLSAEAGSLINATGDLTIGDNTAFDGFYSRGNLEVNNHTVTLNDANEAKLGSLTNIGNTDGAGTLEAANGLVLNGGHNIVGHGLVTADLDNQGSVIGQGPLPGDLLELSGNVTGTGSYAGDILFSGTFSPGNSPAIVVFEDIILEGLLDIEIGGLNPGIEFDVLSGTGEATLGGILNVSLINSFAPELGDSFDILSADTITGEFDLLTTALLGDGLKWDVDYILNESDLDYVRLSVSQVPVPAAVWLFSSGLIGLIGIARRKKA